VYAFSLTRPLAQNGPISHFFYSTVSTNSGYGQDGKRSFSSTALDHARNWDWVARTLRRYHVYRLDCGPRNSLGRSTYSVASMSRPSALLDIIDDFPPLWPFARRGIVLHYRVYPASVQKAVSIEGIVSRPGNPCTGPASEPVPIGSKPFAI